MEFSALALPDWALTAHQSRAAAQSLCLDHPLAIFYIPAPLTGPNLAATKSSHLQLQRRARKKVEQVGLPVTRTKAFNDGVHHGIPTSAILGQLCHLGPDAAQTMVSAVW